MIDYFMLLQLLNAYDLIGTLIFQLDTLVPISNQLSLVKEASRKKNAFFAKLQFVAMSTFQSK